MSKPVTKPQLNLGDEVRVRNGYGMRGQIVELRGPLGANGEQVYRVRIRRTSPPAKFINFREDQLVLIPPKS